MVSRIINLTLLLVIQEVDEVLEDYPEYPYKIACSIHELRSAIILHVLSQIPNYYTLLEDSQELPLEPKFLYSSKQERIHVQNLIRQRIAEIFQENTDSISEYLPKNRKLDDEFTC